MNEFGHKARSANRFSSQLAYTRVKTNERLCLSCDHRDEKGYCVLLRQQVGKKTVCNQFVQQLSLDFDSI